MGCWHGYEPVEGAEGAFSIDASAITFGPGVLGEAGALLTGHGCKRVALFTDPRLSSLAPVQDALRSLRAAGLDVAVYDACTSSRPTSRSCKPPPSRRTASSTATSPSAAARSSTRARPRPCTRPTRRSPHVRERARRRRARRARSAAAARRLPDDVRHRQRVHRHRRLRRPDAEAPRPASPRAACARRTRSSTRRRRARCPAMVVAASGFDVLCHALESYTARPFTARARPALTRAAPDEPGPKPVERPRARCEALRLCGPLPRARRRRRRRRRGARGARLGGDAGRHRVRQRRRAPAARDVLRGRRAACATTAAPAIPAARRWCRTASRWSSTRPASSARRPPRSPERHLEAAAALGADAPTRAASPGDAGEHARATARAADARDGRAQRLGARRATTRPTSPRSPRGAFVAEAPRRQRAHRPSTRTPCGPLPRRPRTGDAMPDAATPRRAPLPRTSAPIPTRWMDNDVYGHVNNVVYYSYFDTVINRYLIERGRPRHPRRRRHRPLRRVALHATARRVAFPDALDAGLRVAHLGRSSVRYEIGIFVARRRTTRRRPRAVRARLRRSRRADLDADPRGHPRRADAPALSRAHRVSVLTASPPLRFGLHDVVQWRRRAHRHGSSRPSRLLRPGRPLVPGLLVLLRRQQQHSRAEPGQPRLARRGLRSHRPVRVRLSLPVERVDGQGSEDTDRFAPVLRPDHAAAVGAQQAHRPHAVGLEGRLLARRRDDHVLARRLGHGVALFRTASRRPR